MTELQHLQQYSIPSAKEVLRENYGNLNKVADYCESNYMQAENKRKALEETMDFTTQSLASVTYQISNLAAHILKVLDLQATKVRQVEANVCSIAQMVDIHKEKVARREIGELAVCKRLLHQQKVIPPASLEPLEPYFRKPLNFSILDSIGHGIKDATGTQLARTGTLTRKGSKTAAGQSPGTLGRSHRIPEPIQPPVIPKGKISAASSTSSLTSLSSLCGVTGSANTKLPPAPPTPPSLPTTLPPPLATDNMPPPPLATIDDMLLPPPPPSLFADMLPPPPASNEILPPDLPPPLSAPGKVLFSALKAVHLSVQMNPT
uniref:Abl-interactor homeo-domain homologous domain-containing protein n=1 Tax=Sphenodon punctatus TaxID=8508 RepID=A0A8D0GQY8_SPHPU